MMVILTADLIPDAAWDMFINNLDFFLACEPIRK
jgi:hypothetical protein